MARDLRSRLAGIRSAPGPRQITEAGNPGAGQESGQRVLAGWNQISPHFWMREMDRKLCPVDPGHLVEGTAFSVRLRDARLSPQGMRFFDLETTGLSGGTGTVAFLATLGRFGTAGGSHGKGRSSTAEGQVATDRFITTQYFMDDYPGEPAMIHRLARDFSEAESIVSYNGGSFDLPLFRTRCILNGVRPPAVPWHLDLLTVARRLWRTVLPDCSLGTIERDILAIDRGPDLPGSAIPERWFSWLRGGAGSDHLLDLVFSHNDQDVRTLALLLTMVAKGFERGQVFRADPVGLAALLGRSNPAQALCILEAAATAGAAGAVKALMRSYWKAGRLQDRLGLVPLLPDDAYGLFMKSISAEKLDRDLESALSFAGRARALASGSMAIRLDKRLKRLKALPKVRLEALAGVMTSTVEQKD